MSGNPYITILSLHGLMRTNGKLVVKWLLGEFDRTSYAPIRSVSNHYFWSCSCRSIINLRRFHGNFFIVKRLIIKYSIIRGNMQLLNQVVIWLWICRIVTCITNILDQSFNNCNSLKRLVSFTITSGSSFEHGKYIAFPYDLFFKVFHIHFRIMCYTKIIPWYFPFPFIPEIFILWCTQYWYMFIFNILFLIAWLATMYTPFIHHVILFNW